MDCSLLDYVDYLGGGGTTLLATAGISTPEYTASYPRILESSSTPLSGVCLRMISHP
jgi:hypothetical protein